jgi:phage N-6-adenine-methyltransferase
MTQDKKALFSANRSDWGTPDYIFRPIDNIFNFDLDVCADATNAKCKRYYTVEDDGLSKPWDAKNAWCNPPYGKIVDDWLLKGYTSMIDHKCTVVYLLPARTDTQWFHKWCGRGNVFLFKGRIKFTGAAHSAPFPSMLLVFSPNVHTREIKVLDPSDPVDWLNFRGFPR